MTEPKKKPRFSARARSTAAFVAVVLVALAVTAYVVYQQGVVTKLAADNKTSIGRLATDEAVLATIQLRQAAEGKTHREQIAASDLQLCTKLYGQIVLLEKTSAAQATVAIYHHLLPSLPLSEIRALVANAHDQAARVEAQFDPKQCHQLPSQKFAPKPAKKTPR